MNDGRKGGGNEGQIHALLPVTVVYVRDKSILNSQ